jgi:predicted nucleic acid-binding protein
VTADQGQRMLATWPQLGVARFAMHPLLRRVWELRANLTAYDAMYVALAEELDCPLVTGDLRLAGASGSGCEVVVLRG